MSLVMASSIYQQIRSGATGGVDAITTRYSELRAPSQGPRVAFGCTMSERRAGGTVADNERGIEDSASKVPGALIIAGIIVIAVAIFVAQNTEDVNFEFLWFNFEWPLWLVLVLVFVLGAFVGQGLMWLRRRRRRSE